MQGAEGNAASRVAAVHLDGVVVGRDDLRGRGGRAQEGVAVYAGRLLLPFQIREQAQGLAAEAVGALEGGHRSGGDAGMEGVGVDVDGKHAPVFPRSAPRPAVPAC